MSESQISIIIPNFNKAKFVRERETLRSLKAQMYSNFEVIRSEK